MPQWLKQTAVFGCVQIADVRRLEAADDACPFAFTRRACVHSSGGQDVGLLVLPFILSVADEADVRPEEAGWNWAVNEDFIALC